MKSLSRNLIVLVALHFLVLSDLFAGVTPIYTSKTGSRNWSDPTSWSTNAVPNSSTDVVIAAGSTVTVDGNFGALSLKITGGTGGNLIIPAGDSLYVFNATTMLSPNSSVTTTITINGKMASSGVNSSQITLQGSSASNVTKIVFGANGVLYCNYNLICNTAGATIDMTAGGLLQIKGTYFNSGTFTSGTGTVAYVATGINQSVIDATYNNIIFGGDHTKTVGTVTVNGTTTMSGTCSISQTFTYGPSASLVYSGSSAQTTSNEMWPSHAPVPVNINNAAGVLLSEDKTFDTTLTMLKGNVNLNGHSLGYGSGSTLIYNGTAAQTTGGELISPIGIPVIISNAAGVTLSQSTTFNGGISCLIGNFDTGANTATVGGGTIAESDGNAIVGTVSTSSTLAQNTNFDFYGIGLEIDAVSNAPGLTTVSRITGTAISGNGYESIKRSYNVTPTFSGVLNAVVVLHYFDSELNGNPDGNMEIETSPDYGTTWIGIGGTNNSTANTITALGVNNWGIYTAINPGTPLPISLLSFTTTATAAGVELHWSTLTETNNYGFYVQRANQLSGPYATISALVAGAGTSLEEHSYFFTDLHVTQGTYYYRICSKNTSGESAYSTPIKVVVEGVTGVKEDAGLPHMFALSQNYPNPFNPSTSIAFSVEQAGQATVRVFNTTGQLVKELFKGMAIPGTGYTIAMDASRLSSGVYYYSISTPTHSAVKKMLLVR